MDTILDLVDRSGLEADFLRVAAKQLGIKRIGIWAFDEHQAELVIRRARRMLSSKKHDRMALKDWKRGMKEIPAGAPLQFAIPDMRVVYLFELRRDLAIGRKRLAKFYRSMQLKVMRRDGLLCLEESEAAQVWEVIAKDNRQRAQEAMERKLTQIRKRRSA